MKRGKREWVIKINFSNKFVYTFILLGILILIGAGVYAYGTSTPSTFGHSIGELDLAGGFTVPTGGLNVSSGNVIIASGKVGIGVTNPPHELEVNGNIGTTGIVADVVEGDTIRALNLEADRSNALYYFKVTGALEAITIDATCAESNYGEIRRCNTGSTVRTLCTCSYQSNAWRWRAF
jgi:hypothetical protein